MGQQRLHPAHVKKFLIWGLGLVVPFLVLFFIFPSGTSLPYNRIVVSQLQVPSLRTQSNHAQIYHRKSEQKPSTSSIDKPDLASKRASDDLSSKKSKKQMNRGHDAPTIITLVDKELDEQTNAEEIQTKESSRKGKIKHNADKISDTGVDEKVPFSGKEYTKQDDDDASERLYKAKSRRAGRKPDREISSLGKEISANEEDPINPRSTSLKQSTRKPDKEISSLGKEISADEEDPISPRSTRKEMSENFTANAEEGFSFLGKETTSKERLSFTKSGKMSYNPYAIEENTSFLENTDKEMFLTESSKNKEDMKREQSLSVENIGGEDDLEHQSEDDGSVETIGEDGDLDDQLEQQQPQDDDSTGGEDDSMDIHIAKPLPFNTKKQSEKCRYYEGRWIIDSKEPLYKDSTCSWMAINDQENCKVINKGTNPIKWRWKPRDCNMERFKIKYFLKLMQRKSLAFVGDKLAKAQMQSLVCLLSQVEKPSLVYDNKNNNSMSWQFISSNFTISMFWSPFLVQEFEENGYKKLHLDKLDTKWAVMVPTLDVLVLGVGSLFIEPTIYMVRDELVGCYSCKDLISQNNIRELSMYTGFRATMRSTIMGVGALPGFEGITLFLQPFGFEGNGSYHSVSMKMKEIQEEEIYQAYKRGSISNQSKMEVLHTNLVSMSKYDPMQGPKNLCLVRSSLADTWNQFLQHTLTNLLNHNSYT